MNLRTRRKSVVFFVTFGVCLVAAAVALNVSWTVLHWRTLGWLLLGTILSLAIIAGLVLNTIFLVREIRRNEQQDSFLNAVTHELKTPIASLRLYLETLKSRDLEEAQRREFYDVMLADSDRLLRTVEQVLLAARTGQAGRSLSRTAVDVAEVVEESVGSARAVHKLGAETVQFHAAGGEGSAVVLGDRNELLAAFSK
ncbi:MAG: sensor histidine kinase, partial [Terriglobales bacterium]